MSSESNQSHWIPMSDLMTGMMLVFMIIAIIYMVRVQQVATELQDTKGKIYRALDKEFSKDLKKWDAEILPNLTIRFKNPESLFPKGRYGLSDKFKSILDDFFPRYFRIVNAPQFKQSIKEILIEGHTDPEFKTLNSDPDCFEMKAEDYVKSFCNNVGLSQDRTLVTLIYLLEITKDRLILEDIMKKVHPHEMASSNPIFDSNGQVDPILSRRVEFRLVTNAEERLTEIAEKLTGK
jgi:outer membrane protein OmpA-like peptidoglycan-associated protein